MEQTEREQKSGSSSIGDHLHSPSHPSCFLITCNGGDTQNVLNKEQRVADHYSMRPNRTAEEREASPIIHLKNLHNWIKGVLIQLYSQPGDSVLDLACGKGRDLEKWDKSRIGYYVGIDIARGAIEDARKTYNDADHTSRRKPITFPAKLICADCFKVALNQVLKNNIPFDICSCQFALHYSWSTEQRARQALENVTELLKPGGYFIGTIPDADIIINKIHEGLSAEDTVEIAAEHLEFGNSIYHIKFHNLYSKKDLKAYEQFGIEYEFHLEDAIDCPEWLVQFPRLKALAEEYGLHLIWKKNFHDFVDEYCKREDDTELRKKLGDLGNGVGGCIPPDEWTVSQIYLAFVFQKEGQPHPQKQNNTQKEEQCSDSTGGCTVFRIGVDNKVDGNVKAYSKSENGIKFP